ncbi:MAG: amidohydrolase [Ignavibacteria bacterium]|nr:amidohydrolase [Ignavibacteria bacterium]
MKLIHFALIFSVLLLLTSCGKSPDTVFVNGVIYTLDDKNTTYEAMAIKDGKIINLGSSNDFKEKYSGKNIVDLKGKCVIPGFTDMEGSLIEFARNLNYINLLGTSKLSDMAKSIEDKAKEKKEDSWIIGAGFNILNFDIDELNNLNREYLDKIAPNHNICIVFMTQDVVLCNTKALNTLQITSATPDPKDGEIGKDEKGNLTGYLYDAAINIVKSGLPDLSEEEYKMLVKKASGELAKYGITEIHDRTVNTEAINLFKKLIDSKELSVKVYSVLTYNDKAFDEYLQKGPEINYGDLLSVRSVSMDYDGALMLNGAQMKDEYLKKSDNNFAYTTPEEIETVFKKALNKKFQSCIKTVGDKAVSSSLSIIEKVLKEKNYDNHRTVLEYTEFVSPEDIKKFGELKIIPSVRPEVSMTNLEIYKQFVPSQNGNNLALWNSLLKSSGYITAGSNFPYSNIINPLQLIYMLVNRQPLDTILQSLQGMNQVLTVEDAVKTFTKYAAYAGFEEEFRGTLEIDKFADFVVLSDDIFKIDPKKIKDLRVIYTAVNGNAVYDSMNK